MSISTSRFKKIDKIKDNDLDYSDIPELDEHFWKKAKVALPEVKQSISIRLDKNVLKWFKSQNKHYQTLINAVLQSYMNAHKK